MGVAVVADQLDDQRRHILGEKVGIGGIVDGEHLGDARDLGRGVGGGAAILSGDQNMDVAANRRRGGHHVERCRLERGMVVFGEKENSHQMTRASFLSLSTSSATEATLRPPWRFTGSSTLSVTRRGATVTATASGVSCSIGFFFAFMMLGSEA